MEASENNFWTEPPWGAGEKKYRLGLRPIELGEWLNRNISENLLKHKKMQKHACKKYKNLPNKWDAKK